MACCTMARLMLTRTADLALGPTQQMPWSLDSPLQQSDPWYGAGTRSCWSEGYRNTCPCTEL